MGKGSVDIGRGSRAELLPVSSGTDRGMGWWVEEQGHKADLLLGEQRGNRATVRKRSVVTGSWVACEGTGQSRYQWVARLIGELW